MQFDPLSDAFVRIFNAEQAGHYEVTVNPASKLLGSMLSIMQQSGYVGEYQKIEDGRGGGSVSYTHLRAHETPEHRVIRSQL